MKAKKYDELRNTDAFAKIAHITAERSQIQLAIVLQEGADDPSSSASRSSSEDSRANLLEIGGGEIQEADIVMNSPGKPLRDDVNMSRLHATARSSPNFCRNDATTAGTSRSTPGDERRRNRYSPTRTC
jgi:hypothetical protein